MSDTPEQARLRAVAARLRDTERLLDAAHDRRAVFTSAYVVITELLADSLQTTAFAEPAWVTQLAEAFARRYFEALDVRDRRAESAEPWQTVFRAIAEERSSVLEDLLYPMTAHLVHDLPLALWDVGLESARGRSRIRDFHLVNDVLARAVDPIEQTIARRYNPVLHWLDRLAVRDDELLTNYGMRVARGMAWYNACRLGDPASLEEATRSIVRSPQEFIKRVRNPGHWWLRAFLWVVRFTTNWLRRWPRRR